MRTSFSPSDAAVEGFRVLRRRPDVVAVWVGLYLVLTFAALGAGWQVLGPDLRTLLTAFQAHLAPSVVQVFAQKVRFAEMLTTPFSVAVQAVFGAAVLRSVIRPESRNFGYLAFGGDEFRQFLVQLVYGAIMVGVTLAWVLFVIVFTAIGIAAAGVSSAQMGKAVLGAIVVGGVVGGAGALYVGVRLSLAPAMTFAEGEFRFFESWGKTRGVFWRLLGAYVLSFLLALIMSLALVVVAILLGGAVYLGVGGPAVFSAHGFGPELVAAVWPAAVAGVVPLSLSSVLYALLLRAPAAHIYLGLSRDPG